MFLQYLGLDKNYKYKTYDFSKGPAEVPDALGKRMLAESPRTFKQVVPADPVKLVPKDTKTTKSTKA